MNAAIDLLTVPELASKQFAYTGIDSLDKCFDRELFINWPHSIEYKYNTRGFRDQEWPLNLKSAVWCLGDSFTVGLGSCFEHTWPQVLSQHSQQRVINVSMDGASNEWIARTICDVYDLAQPRNMVIMWSYLHRREHPDANLSSRDRRLHSVRATMVQDFENFDSCRKQVQTYCADSNLIELVIPNFAPGIAVNFNDAWKKIRDPSWPQLPPSTLEEFLNLSSEIVTELCTLHGIDIDRVLELQKYQHILTDIIKVGYLDRARDGLHFDLVTAEWVAVQVQTLLNL